MENQNKLPLKYKVAVPLLAAGVAVTGYLGHKGDGGSQESAKAPAPVEQPTQSAPDTKTFDQPAELPTTSVPAEVTPSVAPAPKPQESQPNKGGPISGSPEAGQDNLEQENLSLEDQLERKIESGARVEVLNASIVQQLEDDNTWVYDRPLVIVNPNKGGGDPNSELAPFGNSFYIVATNPEGKTEVIREQFDPNVMSVIWGSKDEQASLITGVVIEGSGESARQAPDRYVLTQAKIGDEVASQYENIAVGRSGLATPQ